MRTRCSTIAGWQGLVQVIDRAQPESDLFVAHVVLRSQEDDRDVERPQIGLEAAADVVAVHVGHHHVEQDQAWLRLRLRGPQGIGAVGGKSHPIVVAEDSDQRRDVFRNVVDHQNGFIALGRHGLSTSPVVIRAGKACSSFNA